MGNTSTCKIFYVCNGLHRFLINTNMNIANINILDFFPMLIINRYATLTTINNLKWFASLNQLPNHPLHYKEDKVNNLLPDIISNVLQEEILSDQIRDIIYNIKIIPKETSINRFVLAAGLSNNNKEIVVKILNHPLVNPLNISICYGDNTLVEKYLYGKDIRVNLVESYLVAMRVKSWLSGRFLYHDTKIKSRIIRKNILIKRVFQCISIDIYYYFLPKIFILAKFL